MIQIALDAHPFLRVAAFGTRFDKPIRDVVTPPDLIAMLRADAHAPLQRDEQLRGAVRDMLRYGGYKPTGRGKPASEYLVRAAEDGALTPINIAVDACNVVSLHSGFPISVVDLDRAVPPFRIAIAGTERYVFNASGQEIDLQGLLCLNDASGPCANAVKDAQRTKTNDETLRTLSVVWGVKDHEARLEDAVAWYRQLLSVAGASTEDVEVVSGS